MKTSDFGYDLPQELIAQEPWPVRDQCKLLVLDKETGCIEDRQFFNIEEYLQPGDLLIANETRVLPARLLGKKRGTGGSAEVLLLKQIEYKSEFGYCDDASQYWEALVKPGRRLKPANLANSLGATRSDSVGITGPVVDFDDEDGCNVLSAEVVDWATGDQPGMRTVRLFCETSSVDRVGSVDSVNSVNNVDSVASVGSVGSVDEALHKVGKTPLPPYIHGYAGNMEMYQTVYSANESSAAAPTAGLHFTEELIDRLKNKGVNFETVELEVGIDTFRPVDEEDPRDHKMHTEMYSISQETIDAIWQTKSAGHKVIAVGTTSVRTLESAFNLEKVQLEACVRKPTSLFILPGYKFNVIDGMITNFHVPESTLMMLVSAFGGYEHIMNAYKHAVDLQYRFLSFGDSMFIH